MSEARLGYVISSRKTWTTERHPLSIKRNRELRCDLIGRVFAHRPQSSGFNPKYCIN